MVKLYELKSIVKLEAFKEQIVLVSKKALEQLSFVNAEFVPMDSGYTQKIMNEMMDEDEFKRHGRRSVSSSYLRDIVRRGMK